MDKISVVVGREAISLWKLHIIEFLVQKNRLQNIYVVENPKIDYSIDMKAFSCKGLSKISIHEEFEEIPRKQLQEAAIEEDILWLSEDKIDNTKSTNIYYFSNSECKQKTENEYFKSEDFAASNLTFLSRLSGGKAKVINYSWSEEARFSKNSTITTNLLSLSNLLINLNNVYQEPKLLNSEQSSLLKKNIIVRLYEKIYNLLFYFITWNIYSYSSEINFEAEERLDENQLNPLFNTSKWIFNADQHYLESDNSLLYENFNYFRGIGTLEKLSLETEASVPLATQENNTHYSYPNTFSFENKDYVLPENAQGNALNIYELKNNELNYVNTVSNSFSGIDPTIVFYKDKWYVFVTNGDQGSNSNLYIFYADNPLEEWKEHQLNPVKIDITTARGGGSIISNGDDLIRPTQNCYPSYGTSIIFNKITELSPEKFSEISTGELKVEDSKTYKGIHTIAKSKTSYFVDLKIMQFFPFARVLSVLRSRIKNNQEGIEFGNSLFSRIVLLTFLFLFILLMYFFGFSALSQIN